MFHISVASKSRLSHVTLMPTSEVFPSRFPFIHSEYPGEAQTTRAPKSGDSRKFTPCRFHFSPFLLTLLHFFEVETQNYELKNFHAFVWTHCVPKASEKWPSLPGPWLTVPLRTSASIPVNISVLSTFLLPNFPLISSPLNPDSFQALSLHERNSSLVSGLELEWSRKILKQVVGM